MLFACFSNNCELLVCLQFCSAGTDDIKAAGISELVDVFIIKYKVVILDQTAWAALEA